MPVVEIQAGETDPTKRRVTFLLVATDGITPAEGEAGGQPTAIVGDTVSTTAVIGTLVKITRNSYYAEITESAAASRKRIETRYESDNTAKQIPGDTADVVVAPEVNVKYVNGVAVAGTGVEGDEWGPAP